MNTIIEGLKVDSSNLKKTKNRLNNIYDDKSILLTDLEKKAILNAILLINDIENHTKENIIKKQ